jgi:hypothetical protein
MEYPDYQSRLRQYLFGERRNLIEAALLLQEVSIRFRSYRPSVNSHCYYKLIESYPKVGEVAFAMLDKLRKGGEPCRDDMVELERCLSKAKYYQDLSDRLHEEDMEANSKERRRLLGEDSDGRWRPTHTNYWTGNSCPKGPDD